MLKSFSRFQRTLLCEALVLVLFVLACAGRAEAQITREAASAALSDPHAPSLAPAPELTLADPGDLALARRSLAGPRAEVISGVAILAATPIIAGVAALAAGPGWFPCGLFEDDDDYETQQCEADAARQQEHAARVGIGVGVGLGLFGGALVGHGAYRIHHIRAARRHVKLTGASLDLGQGRAGLTFRASF
jgi:hypothetical protein